MACNVELIYKANLGTGEGPYWLPEENALVFVDIPGHTVYRYDAGTKAVTKATYDGARNLTFIIPIAGKPGKYMVGADSCIALMDWNGDENLVVTNIANVMEHDGNRFNDAKCDRSGRLWAGTMGFRNSNGEFADNLSNLYSLVDQTLKVQVPEVSLSNGLAWSADDKTFFYIDTKKRCIDAFDFNILEGTVSNRREVFNLKDHGYDCFPDGMTIDVDGNLWVATYGGSSILHIDPSAGKVLNKIELPVPNVTSLCWGGADWDELYVTSAAEGTDLNRYPLSGSLFKVTGLGTKGFPNVPVRFPVTTGDNK